MLKCVKKVTNQKRSVLSQSWRGISGVDLNTRPKISICGHGVMYVWMISDVYITSKCNCMGILSLVPLGLLFNDLSTGINLSVFLYRFISFRWYHKNKSIASIKKIYKPILANSNGNKCKEHYSTKKRDLQYLQHVPCYYLIVLRRYCRLARARGQESDMFEYIIKNTVNLFFSSCNASSLYFCRSIVKADTEWSQIRGSPMLYSTNHQPSCEPQEIVSWQ